jgi:hypothetical protein
LVPQKKGYITAKMTRRNPDLKISWGKNIQKRDNLKALNFKEHVTLKE